MFADCRHVVFVHIFASMSLRFRMWTGVPSGSGMMRPQQMGNMHGQQLGVPQMSGGSPVPSASSGNGTASPASNICRFFLSGGCMRGESCPYLHELPDERHLDVNGVGFIFNSNAQNTHHPGASRKMTPPSQRKAIPRYRPPEQQLDYNVPPALGAVFSASESNEAAVRGLMRLLNSDGRSM